MARTKRRKQKLPQNRETKECPNCLGQRSTDEFITLDVAKAVTSLYESNCIRCRMRDYQSLMLQDIREQNLKGGVPATPGELWRSSYGYHIRMVRLWRQSGQFGGINVSKMSLKETKAWYNKVLVPSLDFRPAQSQIMDINAVLDDRNPGTASMATKDNRLRAALSDRPATNRKSSNVQEVDPAYTVKSSSLGKVLQAVKQFRGIAAHRQLVERFIAEAESYAFDHFLEQPTTVATLSIREREPGEPTNHSGEATSQRQPETNEHFMGGDYEVEDDSDSDVNDSDDDSD